MTLRSWCGVPGRDRLGQSWITVPATLAGKRRVFLTAPRTSAAALEQVPSINSPEQREKGISSRMPLAPAFRAFATEGTVMRAHHAIAVVAVILVGVGVKLIFFTAPTAEADPLSLKSVGVDVSQLHQNVKNLPVQKFHDMSFVFSDGD
jgi:hypothetical protein